MKTKTTPTSQDNETTRLGESIKLGVDVHMEKYVVVMKIDGSSPSRPRSFNPEDFLLWAKQLREMRQPRAHPANLQRAKDVFQSTFGHSPW